MLTLQVRDSTLAVSMVDDYGASARLLAATTLRNVLGTKSLEARSPQSQGNFNMLYAAGYSSREGVHCKRDAGSAARGHGSLGCDSGEGRGLTGPGIKCTNPNFCIQVKDVRVPEQLMRAMAAEAEAARNARAKVGMT